MPTNSDHPARERRMPAWLWPPRLLALIGALAFLLAQPSQASAANVWARWTNGPSIGPDFFPIAVWLQDPKNATRYKAAGINLYVGLWRGPTQAQLSALEEAGMHLFCAQNALGLEQKDNPIIVGWMHGDEPDNAQSLGSGRGYGPPIPPEKILADYRKIQAADPTRPVLLNLGQGVAWDNYIGRGVRRRHPEDYAEYVKGCDIASFDIYPAVHDSPEVAGKLEFVARGVERLMEWTGGAKAVWNCIECARIGNPDTKPTADQVRAEVWMALIHGSRGLIYFVHQFKPAFREAALLDDLAMLEAVTKINQRIQSLAPVLNSGEAQRIVVAAAPQTIATLAKRHEGLTYLFAVNMRSERARCSLRMKALAGKSAAEALDEDRSVQVQDGAFEDEFEGYAVHLYRISGE